MKKFFLLSLSVILPAYSSAWSATSGSCGENCSFEIIDGILNISGTGNMSSNWYYVNQWPGYYTTPWYGENYEKVVIADGITSIGANAFARSNATEISIPSSVTYIENGVFSSSKFRELTIPSSVENFSAGFTYMTNLQSITFEGTVPDLSSGRFEGTGQNVIINYTGGAKVKERIQEMMQTAGYNWHGWQGYAPKNNAICQQFVKNDDGSTDFYDSNDNRVKTVFNSGVYIVYDPQTGRKLGKYNTDGTLYQDRPYYTIPEAIEATKDGDKFSFSITF